MAVNNRTVTITSGEVSAFRPLIRRLSGPAARADVVDAVICQDMREVLPLMPSEVVDLLILDPPYNLRKTFGNQTFRVRDITAYSDWIATWLGLLPRLLKPTASVYFCADWRMGTVVASMLQEHFIVRNRITWERDKGRGAARNWKNCAEDIWFATKSDGYTFDAEAVRLKRRVLAPYRDDQRRPKDWEHDGDGAFRLTAPSNLWNDITIPFWSMPENTEHPTQKPEKLVAKLILASSNAGDVVLDPFLGSGTSAVVARKLNRRFVGIDIDEKYCCLTLKRLAMARTDKRIQGLSDGVFWERNTLNEQLTTKARQHDRRRRRA